MIGYLKKNRILSDILIQSFEAHRPNYVKISKKNSKIASDQKKIWHVYELILIIFMDGMLLTKMEYFFKIIALNVF